MAQTVYNFGAGPAKLPLPVIQQIQADFLDFRDMGSSIIEISHRSKQFDDLLGETDELFKELVALPDNYKMIYAHGGARMQFSAVPLNIINRSPSKKALYVETGNFAKIAIAQAKKYGDIKVVASSVETNHDRIPVVTRADFDQDASYAYITSNNTAFGTRWNEFPDTGEVPLVVDATSELLSRQMDYNKFGIIFAGAQKNLGPSGIALVIVREDLLDHVTDDVPELLNYSALDKKHSLLNTANTFGIYVMNLVFNWVKQQGGVAAIQRKNEEKAALLYNAVDSSSFYTGHAQPEHRSIMNVTYNLPSRELLDIFLSEASNEGLTALKGYRLVGGIRASIYNAMPIEGVQALVDFMKTFESKHG